MTNYYFWIILVVVFVILLIVYRRTKNAVWGGLTIGIIIGFIVAFFNLFKGNGFDWFIIGKSAVIFTILGFVAELLGKISDNYKRKHN